MKSGIGVLVSIDCRRDVPQVCQLSAEKSKVFPVVSIGKATKPAVGTVRLVLTTDVDCAKIFSSSSGYLPELCP